MAAKRKAITTIADLQPDDKNANRGTVRGRAALETSMGQYGAGRSILADRNGKIIAGNKTLEQAADQNFPIRAVHTDGTELVVVVRDDLDLDNDPRARALAFADNRIAELDLEWEPAAFAEARDMDLDLSAFFTGDELDELIESIDRNAGRDVANADLGDPEAIPAPPAVPISRLGDRWMLGDHRLVVGDATDPVALTRLFAGTKANGVMTSPPYAQQRSYDGKMAPDWLDLVNRVFAALHAFLYDDAQLFVNLGLVHKDGRVIRYWEPWLDAMEERGIPCFGWYVWDKLAGMPGDWNGRLAPAHEWVFHFALDNQRPAKTIPTKGGKTGKTQRNQDGTMKAFTQASVDVQPFKIPDSVIRTPAQRPDTLVNNHPAPYPVALPQAFLQAWPRDLWFDPFMGAGTTLIAAQIEGVTCYGMELNPAYADVILQRWADFTGDDPEREDGVSWRDLRADAGR